MLGVIKTKQKARIWLGQREPIIDPNFITWASRPLKSLGMFFGKDIEERNKLDWSIRLKKLELA